MSNEQDFELPSPLEKLSHKFIMDSLHHPHPEEETPPVVVVEETPAATQECGTEVELAPEPLVEETLLETEPDATAAEEEATPVEYLALPEGKKYFRIGEVSQLLGVEPYVLRYWENEFSSVRPVKSKSGQRVYSRRDVETLHYIRHLLHVEKFSIKGAKKKVLERRRQVRTQNAGNEKRDLALKAMIGELKEMITLLKTDPGTL
jgi:DNA-binding transcriptional MerR regulator